jgi:hypothetical protein
VKHQDPIAEAAAEAAKTQTSIKPTHAAKFLPFDVRKARAWFPDGLDGSDEKYSSQNEVSEFLKGKRVNAVEFTNHNTIKFVFDDGLAVTLTPSGIEGDDLDLVIEKTASA